VVLVDGRLVANRARVAFVKDKDLIDRAAARAELHPDDLTDEVTTLLQVCRSWGTSKPAPVVDVRGLIAEWTDTDITVDLTTGSGGRAGTPAPVTTSPAGGGVPAQPRPATGARGGRPDGRLRQLVLTHVLTHAGVTRAQARDHAIAAGYSQSGAYKEISQLIQDGAVREDDQGHLIATLWDHQVPTATAGGTW
jgi:hypothetical protein